MVQRVCQHPACRDFAAAQLQSADSFAAHIGYVRTMAAAAAAFLELQGRQSLTAPVRANYGLLSWTKHAHTLRAGTS